MIRRVQQVAHPTAVAYKYMRIYLYSALRVMVFGRRVYQSAQKLKINPSSSDGLR